MVKKQEKKFRKEYAPELFKIAQGDLDSAKGLTSAKLGRVENVCFHVQQAIEKALKAVLCHHEIPVPLVHDLGILLAKLPEDQNFPFGYEINDLNDYAAIRRYEEGVIELSWDDAASVIKIGDTVLKWAGKIVPVTKS